MIRTIFSIALIASASAGLAQAQQDVIATANSSDWRGFYIGADIGGTWNHMCESWEPGAAITSGNYPGLTNRFYNRDCPDNGNLIGDVDLGYNFQYNPWVWGFKLDYDAVSSVGNTHSYNFAGGTGYPIASGTYTTHNKVSSNGIILVGPRVGYPIDQWLTRFRVDSAFSTGSRDRTISFIPVWTAGIDYAISGARTLTAEYNIVNLGKGSNSNVSCVLAQGQLMSASATGRSPRRLAGTGWLGVFQDGAPLCRSRGGSLVALCRSLEC
jgi:opacity protein-like surface antigen